VTTITGDNALAGLPQVPYVCGSGAVDDLVHAIPRERAARALRKRELFQRAVCDTLAYLAPRHGAFDRATLHQALDPCPECAWALAITAGTAAVQRELDALTPTGHTLDALTRLTGDPLIARRTCQAILAEANSVTGHLADEQTLQLLATVSRHAPVTLLYEGCRDGDCEPEHDPAEPCPAQPACPACSLQAGQWAGEWEGLYLPECTIPAPCQVLLTLAARFLRTQQKPVGEATTVPADTRTRCGAHADHVSPDEAAQRRHPMSEPIASERFAGIQARHRAATDLAEHLPALVAHWENGGRISDEQFAVIVHVLGGRTAMSFFLHSHDDVGVLLAQVLHRENRATRFAAGHGPAGHLDGQQHGGGVAR
jgi:hypothetical protein